MKYEPPNDTFIPTHSRYTSHPGQQAGTHDRRVRPWVHGDVELHPSTIHPAREVRDKAVPSSNQGRPGRAQEEGQSSKAATERGQPDEGNKVAAAEATLSRTHQEKNRTGQGKNGAPNPNCQALLSTLRICYVVLFVSVGV